MTRMSKKGERRHRSPRKRHYNAAEKTGPKKDNLPKGYREHTNNITEQGDVLTFIPGGTNV